MRRIAAVAAGVAVAICARPAAAQTVEQCRKTLIETGTDSARIGPDPCMDLARKVQALAPAIVRAADVILRTDSVRVGSIFSQRDLQARHTQQPSLGGSAAQGHAIPGVQPAGVAAGTIAAVGTDAGNEALAALGLNPVILFIGEEVSRELARYSRFMDLTLLLPVSQVETQPASATQPPEKVDYVGVRLRFNITGLSAGDSVWSGARRLIRNWMLRGDRNVTRVRETLRSATDVHACATTLLETEDAARITGACGAPVSLDVNLAEAELLQQQLAGVRRAADANYLGVDLRADVGDPSLGVVPNASGVFWFAGLAQGKRLSRARERVGPEYGVRWRLGARHATLDSARKSEFAAEGGIGFEFSRMIEDEEINAALAVEFREGNARTDLIDQFQTNFIMLRGSFILPVTSGNSVSITVGVPLRGDVSRILSVNFNWGLLFPDGRGR